MVKPNKLPPNNSHRPISSRVDVVALKKPGKLPGDSQVEAKTTESHVFNLPNIRRWSGSQKILSFLLFSLLIFIIGMFSLRAAYAQRVYPGVWGNGIYLGGLTKNDAKKLLDEQTATFIDTPLFVTNGQNNTKIDLHSIDLTYNNQTLVDELYAQCRTGSIFNRLSQQISLMLGGAKKNTSNLNYSGEKLSSTLDEVYNKTAAPVSNATFDYADNKLTVEPGKNGQRLDLGGLILDIDNHLRLLDIKQIKAESITIKPLVGDDTIAANRMAIENFVSKPLKLTGADKSWNIEVKNIVSWLKYPGAANTVVKNKPLLTSYYSKIETDSQFSFDRSEIKNYLGEIAGQINVDAQDAQLTIEGDKATVFKQSRDGKKLDIDKSADVIFAALTSANSASRTVALQINTTKADVDDDNINNLGIKELLSEGVSYFPGSSAARLTNVRIGASKFNGVLLKPDDTFSFGALLGDVGPEQGYAKSYVILDGKQGTDYGGGLCQVSSTAYRAALLAGLPIVERHNHAFAVSYYTEPYGVPGVDATIYYPQVDMKFKNDTGAYILIQTEMKGTTLKFRFYGTKTKSGVIRGPQFISGNNDANQPSHTVFYRDVMVNGAVAKTDTINTYYKSALDYPHIN